MGLDDRESAIKALVTAYEHECCRSGSPTWAFRGIAPAIPYIGEQYFTMAKKVLIYASAENLASDHGHRNGLFAKTTSEQMRRSYWAKCYRDEEQNVMIEPINNGSLLMAARHALHRFQKELSFSTESASSFLRQVAVANPSKFSIAADQNIDPAKEPKYWQSSKPFIEADMAVLQPDMIILPRSILRRLRSKSIGLDLGVRGRAILPNYQITSGTINRTIIPMIKRLNAPPLSDTCVKDWKLTLGAKNYAMNDYLRWIDSVASLWVERPTEQ